jgi:hypothetical protein
VSVIDTLDGTEFSACNKTIGELVIGQVVIYTCERADTQKAYTNVVDVT